ncbi:EpsG family protein [Empedobacter sp. 225-1]|uniref:hypothetical protein n=1 Tax=Empedobacter sp. 225-1 TaxID=2746725 RepID=UPI00257848BA|nr:hypothetical protein [Empedobacter sp. 225-1]MDM1522306.1 EpsG family protein [Empedobacter sp. 225-1]
MYKKLSSLGTSMVFLNPPLGLILSFFDIRSKSSYFIYIFFGILFGASISFSDSSADSYRYAKAFASFDNSLDYNAIIRLYRDGELRDIYRLFIFYISSVFTNNPKIMYGLAGGIYAYLSYKCILIFRNEYFRKIDLNYIILALIFYTYVSLSNINGFRFWTGALIFFLANYNIVLYNKKYGYLLLLLTPLFHYGFIMVMPVMVVYCLLHDFFDNKKKPNKFLWYIFLFTFFISWFLRTNSINLGFISNADLVDGAIGQRLNYVNSNEVSALVDKRRENSVFLSVQKYFDMAIKIFVFIVVVYIKKNIKLVGLDKRAYFNKLFNFVLFFYSFSFIAISFPSGSRFLNIAHMFFLVLIVLFYNYIQNQKQFSNLLFFAFFSFSFNIAFINFMLPLLILDTSFWYGTIMSILINVSNFII